MAGTMPGGNTLQKVRQSLPQGRECPTLEPSTDCKLPAEFLPLSCSPFSAWVSQALTTPAGACARPLSFCSPAPSLEDIAALLLCDLCIQQVMGIALLQTFSSYPHAAELCTW